jgi:hypothetical protein
MSPPLAALPRKARKNALCLRYTKDPNDPRALAGAAYALTDYGDALNASLAEQWKQMVKAKNDDPVVKDWANRLHNTVKYFEAQASAGTILVLKGVHLGVNGSYDRYYTNLLDKTTQTFAKVNGGTVKQSEIVATIPYDKKKSIEDLHNEVIKAVDSLQDPGTDF